MSREPAVDSVASQDDLGLIRQFPCGDPAQNNLIALHLPVAPRCNVQCNYCDRSSDCANNSPRGSTSILLTPQQAVVYALKALGSEPRISCAGVAGPGDPLANPEATFGTLSLLREQAPHLPFFIATNGIDLLDHVDTMVELGVTLCTVTVNAVDPDVLARTVDWVQGPNGLLTGEDAARYFIARQTDGIRAVTAKGITVRINFQLLPSINDHQTSLVAQAVAAAGARFFHVQPFSPGHRTSAEVQLSAAPSAAAVSLARKHASAYLQVVRHCSLCASDSLGCMAGGQVRALRSVLKNSAQRRDLACAGVESKVPEADRAQGERGVALRQLQLIAKVARWLATSNADTLTTLQRVLTWLDEELELKRAVIALVDNAGETLYALVTHDVDPSQEERMRYRPDEGLTGQVFTSGQPVFQPSLKADPTFLDRSGLRQGLDLSRLAFFGVPIRDQATVIGTLSADKDNTLLKDADSDLRLLEEVAQLLAPFVQRRRLEESLSLFRQLRKSEGPFGRLVGRSAIMEEVRRMIAKVVTANTTVLLAGETGTGKSAAAALIHELSARANGPFIEVNCGAIPDALIESELFGHERGAFTSAVQRRLGVFERGRGGTVFLDEVGELGPSAQTRLLRVLQTRRFERVGGTETLTTDARVIAATNRDLANAVETGAFRADLYYRLNVFPITMPPLRERGKADIMLLADQFVARHGAAQAKSIFRIDTPAIDMLTAYHWPGNVRELDNVIERATVLTDTDVIHGHHLPPSLQMNRYSGSPEQLDFASRVASFEIELITEALKDANGNQTKAAERLGLTKRIIQYKIRTYGIDWTRFLPKG